MICMCVSSASQYLSVNYFAVAGCDLSNLPKSIYNDPSKGPSVKIPSGTSVDVDCRKNYKEGNHSISCHNGQWTDVTPPCEGT